FPQLAGPALVVYPESGRRLDESRGSRAEMISLAQKMRHGEADVEGGIAPVDNFVIEQDQLITVNENILRAVVAVDDRQATSARLSDELFEKRPSFRSLFRGVGVIRFDAERFEETAVVEDLAQRVGRSR